MPTPADIPRQRITGRRPVLARDHPCSVGFLDETGAIARDRIFGVGLLRSSEPSRLLRAVQKYRDKKHWYKEFKYTDVTTNTLDLYKGLVDTALDSGEQEFWCFIADRSIADPIERFGSSWTAYSKLAEQLIYAALRRDELISLLADNYSTPDSVLFEEDVRSNVNRRLSRLAVVSCCRLDSKSSDGLQLADLFTSSVALEFRAATGVASSAGKNPKSLLAAHVREGLGTTTCIDGWRNEYHSVQLYEHGSWTPSG